jgi:hypothetical protein
MSDKKHPLVVTEDELNQEEINKVSETERELQTSKEVPNDYQTVTLPSRGLLGYPDIIHVRNFSTEDITSILMLDDESAFQGTIKALRKCIWEKELDTFQLHQDDALYIIVQIIKNWWNPDVTLLYPYEQEELDNLKKLNQLKYQKVMDKINKDEGVEIKVPISKLKFKKLKKGFKAPFKMHLNDKGDYIKMDVNRLEHLMVAKNYIGERFEDEDKEMRKLVKSQQDDDNYRYDYQDKLINYTDSRTTILTKLLKAQLIVEYNGQVLETIEDKLRVYNDVAYDAVLWASYEEVMEKYAFGVVKDITHESPLTGEETNRRYYFRPSIIFQNIEVPRSNKYVVTFE